MSQREHTAIVMNCPSFIAESDPSPEDFIWTADSEAYETDDYTDDYNDSEDEDLWESEWESGCDCHMCREEFCDDDCDSQEAEPSQLNALRQQVSEYAAKISDLTETLNVQLNYSDEIWRLQNQLTESQSSSQTAWNESAASSLQIDKLRQQLKAQVIYSDVQLESCRNYLNQTWTESAKWWKGFDLYLFGVWISLRKTPDGWKLKSGSRSVE